LITCCGRLVYQCFEALDISTFKVKLLNMGITLIFIEIVGSALIGGHMSSPSSGNKLATDCLESLEISVG
jgi:hypothetical protein